MVVYRSAVLLQVVIMQGTNIVLDLIIFPFFIIFLDSCSSPRDLRTLWRSLCAHASQVCCGGRPVAHHGLPQLDVNSSAEQQGEHHHHWGARSAAALHRGVPQAVDTQWSDPSPPEPVTDRPWRAALRQWACTWNLLVQLDPKMPLGLIVPRYQEAV